MKTIEKKAPDLIVGKKYFLDNMKDVSAELVNVKDGWLIFGQQEGRKCYIEHEDGTIKFQIDRVLHFHEIVEE